ncbi:transposase [Clostridia bacterium]|nr:transposase [Clostridia bacterium]
MSRYYTDEFKKKIVELRKNGKPLIEIAKENGIARSSISTWMNQYENSGKWGIKDNLSDSEKELRTLRKENKQLLMENDILKQAALIMARK